MGMMGSIPLLLNFFERACLLKDINQELFRDVGHVAPEFLLWAITGAGTSSTRHCYEVLESYGDTVLKLAATMLAYSMKRHEIRAGEGDIENSKVVFVTNFHVFRVGYHQLRTHRFMQIMRDPEPKEWTLPLQGPQWRKN